MEWIKRAIAQMLYNSFGEGHKIYTEKIEQGFDRPCFFIDVDNGEIKRFLNGGRLFCFNLGIYYYPEADGKVNESLLEAAIKIFEGCENISSEENRLKYLESSYHIEDNKLVFNAGFKLKINKEEEKSLMERLFLNGK